jgi:serine phosphatase RsbU (regulator of sigma subunit)
MASRGCRHSSRPLRQSRVPPLQSLAMPFQPAPAALSIPGFDGYSTVVPCHGETQSGDGLFEEVGRQDGRCLLLLVDVAGHGPPAARVLSIIAERLLPDARCHDRDPRELLAQLNERLEPTFAATSRFVTALAILIDGGSGKLVGGNAGQPLPRIGRAGGAWAVWSIPGGAPLGVHPPGTMYDQGEAVLAPGEYLLAFSDGVTEAGAKGHGQELQRGPLDNWLAGLPAGLPLMRWPPGCWRPCGVTSPKIGPRTIRRWYL